MMDAFSAVLEARVPALGRFRSYRLEAGPDLFGVWVFQITFGRIGTAGRPIHYSVGDATETKKLVQRSIRRRATAKQHIGVPYRFCALCDPWQWLSLPPDLLNRPMVLQGTCGNIPRPPT